ncbi:MAG: (d)CMP kinase [Saprospirales bacterium]|nr:MAG: (d)CMP kinase [Saprospirales bacterium]
MPTIPEKRINIAIDGYSGCGKSTLAKEIADCLHYIYLDSGAMYRAVTHYFQENKIDYLQEDQLLKALENINIRFERKNVESLIFLNNENISKQIRTLKVSNEVSKTAALSPIRRFLVAKQKKLAINKGVIMEGRDIGTVVLPDAEYKLFLTAQTEVRVERRFRQLKESGSKVSKESIRKNLEQRDFIDSSRKDSPLKCADDALILDNTNFTREEQLNFVLNDLRKKFPFIVNYCE